MRKQALETQTIYAELVERLIAFEATRAVGHVRGTFTTKVVKGERYVYFQYLEPGGVKRQTYLGRHDEVLERAMRRYAAQRPGAAEERASIRRLCALLRAGGAQTTDAASERVLRALADAGLFRSGCVLVGTHAFTALGNALGVVWDGAWMRTHDIDLASGGSVDVAVEDAATEGRPATGSADVQGVLESLEMGFLPVPSLDRGSPSTSYKVRGKALRVDLLTPVRGRMPSGPVAVPRLGAVAQPLRYLDYVMESPIRAAVVAGDGVLVTVPEPARFAFHKLIVADERPAVFHAKRDKDLHQAAQLFEVLVDERPGDVAIAWEALEARGAGWVKHARSGLAAMRTVDGAVAARVREAARGA
ncbi:MAG: hypothetical protein FDZ70_10595 [Actinobacteria bacterium]|nr:MAG: hypothetical protein FDZ70_10595 [Actinomycetota bacterium]